MRFSKFLATLNNTEERKLKKRNVNVKSFSSYEYCQQIQEELNSVVSWFKEIIPNNIILYQDKVAVMSFTRQIKFARVINPINNSIFKKLKSRRQQQLYLHRIRTSDFRIEIKIVCHYTIEPVSWKNLLLRSSCRHSEIYNTLAKIHQVGYKMT